ncbi:MAG: hypothetical protein WC621_02600 [Patescibacteria group bacterium]
MSIELPEAPIRIEITNSDKTISLKKKLANLNIPRPLLPTIDDSKAEVPKQTLLATEEALQEITKKNDPTE